jgi:hypothetical protein
MTRDRTPQEKDAGHIQQVLIERGQDDEYSWPIQLNPIDGAFSSGPQNRRGERREYGKLE